MKQLSSFGGGWLLLALLAQTPFASRAQAVGIGTTTPSANAALDVSSTSKGLMLPRLPSTSSVAKPSAGLFIYNKKLQAPAYHDGTRWNTLAAAASGAAATAGQPDSVTYVLTTTGGGFTSGTFATVTDFASGITNTATIGTGGGGGTGKASFQNVVISKRLDANSVPFAQAVITGMHLTGPLEFQMFVPGAATPSYSVKLTNIVVVGYTVKVGAGAALLEQITLIYSRIGYKDWVTGKSFSWDLATNRLLPY